MADQSMVREVSQEEPQVHLKACEDPLPGQMGVKPEPDPYWQEAPTSHMTGMFQFANTEAIKQKVRNQRHAPPPYNVHDRYHKSGIFQRIAKDPFFENLTLAIIVVNAIWIWIDTDYNDGDTLLDADPIFKAMDSAFFAYFSFELFVRFMAFKRKCDCMKDGWFVFDSILVTLYAFDPFTIALIVHVNGGGNLNLPTAVLRLFRLARLSRLVRMLRSLPELMIMIKGMMTASFSVVYSLALLVLITYVFGIALVNLKTKDNGPCLYLEIGPDGDECPVMTGVPFDVGETPLTLEECSCTAVYFPSVLEAMVNLIVFATFCDDLSAFIKPVKLDSTPSFLLCWLYIALSALTVMNMLIGVLCEVISAVAEEEKESMMCDKVHDRFTAVVSELDQNNDGTLSWPEFQQILEHPEALKALEAVDVDAETMVDLAEDFFFEDGEPIPLSFDQFMELVLDTRGGQQATVKNVMSLGKRCGRKFMGQKKRMDTLDMKLDNVNIKFDGLLKSLGLEVPNYHAGTTLTRVSSNLSSTMKSGSASPKKNSNIPD